jgi:hypothetical protein
MLTCKVNLPRPIIYTFLLTGLHKLEWGEDFDRKHGRYESNKRSEISHCIALQFDCDQREPARLLEEPRCLSINGRTLAQLVLLHARTQPDRMFESRDMKLFFETPSNAFNDADRWWGYVGFHLVNGTPLEEINNMEDRYLVAKEREFDPDFWERLRPTP